MSIFLVIVFGLTATVSFLAVFKMISIMVGHEIKMFIVQHLLIVIPSMWYQFIFWALYLLRNIVLL
jgi:hypothetical protein